MNPQLLSQEKAADFAVFSMMANNAYHSAKKIYFPVELAGWQLMDKKGKPSKKPTHDGAVSYDIYVNNETNVSAFVFRGTDSVKDYILSSLSVPISIGYLSARKRLREYMEENKKREVIAVGHSLGGGLALSCSVHLGVDAYAFNSTPRIFDGFGDHHKIAARVMVSQSGEPLEKLRKIWGDKLDACVGEENTFQCNYKTSKDKSHKSDWLAVGMARQAASASATVSAILADIPKSELEKYD